MQFPGKPSFFDLNELESRLIAPRLAFQNIFQAPRGGQLKITGNVVNVPADVNSTVNMLPRLPDETGTIKVQLKRRSQYKISALSLNIRPHKVMQAAAWLVNTSPLYEGEGITVDPKVVKEMELLRNECTLNLCFTPLYMLENTDLKICYLNARSLHKHINDVRKDINYLSADILIFTETRFSPHDTDEMYPIEGYELFRNDDVHFKH